MRGNLIPSPPKMLIAFLGLISLVSFLLILVGTYGFSSVELDKKLYKVTCSFTQDKKEEANKLFEELQSQDLEPEIVSNIFYKTEDKGFIVVLSFEGKDRELYSKQTKAVVETNGFNGKIFTPEMNPLSKKIQVGSAFKTENEARNFARKVFDKTAIQFAVEINRVVVGEQKIFGVVLKTQSKYMAEDFRIKLTEKGYSPEVTGEKVEKN